MAAVYTAGMALMFGLATQPYDQPHLLMREVWWQVALLALVTVAIAFWTRLRIQRSLRVTWFSLLLIVPVVATIAGGVYSMYLGGTDWPSVWIVVLGTFFVGIGEEVAYRGVVLNALGQRVTVFWAVMISAILFGFMHLPNLLVADSSSVYPQVVITAFVGLLFAWTYISTGGNLLLLIVLHWLYDAFLMAPVATDFGTNYTNGAPAMAICVIALVATIVMGIHHRGRSLESTLSRVDAARRQPSVATA